MEEMEGERLGWFWKMREGGDTQAEKGGNEGDLWRRPEMKKRETLMKANLLHHGLKDGWRKRQVEERDRGESKNREKSWGRSVNAFSALEEVWLKTADKKPIQQADMEQDEGEQVNNLLMHL